MRKKRERTVVVHVRVVRGSIVGVQDVRRDMGSAHERVRLHEGVHGGDGGFETLSEAGRSEGGWDER